MPRKPTIQQLFAELEARYGPEVARAFLDAVSDLRSSADLQRFIAAIADGNIEAALLALSLDAEAYAELADVLDRAFREAGRASVTTLPKKDADGNALVLRFGRTPEAETWLRNRSSNLITRTLEDQRNAVRASLAASLEQNIHPRQAALRVVGTINRVTGRREGGILGLTTAQEGYVRSARAELQSGDLTAYLARTRRDRRFDRSIASAIREGRPVPAETIKKAVSAYEGRLLKLRGEIIARTETLASLNAASYEAIRQAVASGRVPAGAVKRVWRATFDTRTRDTHAAMHSDSVGLLTAFRSPSGALLMFPGDTSLGAPASEIVACRCYVENRIDYRFNGVG